MKLYDCQGYLRRVEGKASPCEHCREITKEQYLARLDQAALADVARVMRELEEAKQEVLG